MDPDYEQMEEMLHFLYMDSVLLLKSTINTDFNAMPDENNK